MECAAQGDCDIRLRYGAGEDFDVSPNGVRRSRRLRLHNWAATEFLSVGYPSEWSAPLKAIATLLIELFASLLGHVRMECAAQGDCDDRLADEVVGARRPNGVRRSRRLRHPSHSLVREAQLQALVRMECAAQGDCDSKLSLPNSLSGRRPNGVRRSRRLRLDLLISCALNAVPRPNGVRRSRRLRLPRE